MPETLWQSWLSGFTRSSELVLLLIGLGVLATPKFAQGQTFTATASPGSVCVGGTITVTVADDCTGDFYSEGGNLYFGESYDGLDLGDLICTAITNGVYYYTGTYTTQTSDAGEYLVWTFYSHCYGPVSTALVPVVAANSVTYSPNYADNWVSNTITFCVHLIPTEASAPCTITWTGLGVGESTGQTVSTYYTSTGSHTATATVGTSTKTSSAVTAHTLVSTTDVSVPAPTTRTDLGIGETVTLSISPSASTAATWTLLNPGNSSLAQIGSTGTYSFGAGTTPSTSPVNLVPAQTGGTTPSVQCQLGDANSPVMTAGPYTIWAPRGMNYFNKSAVIPAPYDQTQLGNRWFGYGTKFLFQVLPINVSFTKISIQEFFPNPPGPPTHTLPNPAFANSPLTLGAGPFPETLSDQMLFGGVKFANVGGDIVAQPMVMVGALLNGQGVAVADQFAVNVPVEYQKDANTWVQFEDGTHNVHRFDWTAGAVTTLTCTGKDNGNQQSTQPGNGPWNAKP